MSAARRVSKHLSADILFRLLHSIFSSVADPRSGEVVKGDALRYPLLTYLKGDALRYPLQEKVLGIKLHRGRSGFGLSGDARRATRTASLAVV